MLDVTADFAELQGFEVIANGDALAQVLQFGLVKMFAEFGLAHEDDLEELAIVGFQVGQEADLLEQFVGHVLGFIDNEDGIFFLVDQAEEELVEKCGGFEAVEIEAFYAEAKFHGDGFDEAVAIEHGVENEGGFPIWAELFEHGAADGSFAGADLAGELDEPLPFANAVEEMVIGFAVLWAEEKKARVWRDIERRFVQAIVLQIHGLLG